MCGRVAEIAATDAQRHGEKPFGVLVYKNTTGGEFLTG
jgi:hypothetical protein